MTPTNEERRDSILAQHVRLRSTIHSVQQVAQAAAGASILSDQLIAAIATLQKDVLEHLAEEERLLEPAFSRLGARETLRVSLLRAEHAHQRAVLAMLNAGGAKPPGGAVAIRTLELCDHLLADMDFEERELLDDMLLPPESILDDV
jgi:iron-sulfur cluster repair protein YtfE (RIC family)